jgi:predicted MPP superfamily phosphohydrolase
MFLEAGMVKLEKVRFTKSKNCLKFMHISDVHIRHLRVSTQKVKNIINNEKPHFIIITGDYVQTPGDKDRFLDFLREIKSGNTIYMCLGNHDYEAYGKDKAGLESFIKSIKNTGSICALPVLKSPKPVKL